MKERLRHARATRWVRITTIFAVLATFVAGGTTVFAGSSNPGRGLQNEQQLRVENDEAFLTQHRDSSGQLRPDLFRQGVQAFRNLPISAAWHDGRVSGKALALPGSASATSSAITGAFW